MAKQCVEKYFNMPAGAYCGVLLREPLAKKMQKLLYKQAQEIKVLLMSNLDDVEAADWTLVYPLGDDGKPEQTTIHYFSTAESDEKIRRIDLFDGALRLRFCKNGVFETTLIGLEAVEDVQTFYNEHFETQNSDK